MATMPITVFNDISGMNKPKTCGCHCWSMDMWVTLEQASAWGPSWHLQGVTYGMVLIEEVVMTPTGQTQLPAGTCQLHMNQLFQTVMGAIPDCIFVISISLLPSCI